MISIIVAMDKNRGIGYKGDLLTYIPGDLPRFKKITTGHTVIMGRKTFDSLPSGPLPNRNNIVITRNRELKIDGAKVVNSLDEAIKLCSSDDESFIIGGGEIYKESLKIADKLYITHINKKFEADTYFPEIPSGWIEFSREDIDNKGDFSFSYVEYIKA